MYISPKGIPMSGPMIDLEARWKRLGGHTVGCDCELCKLVRADVQCANAPQKRMPTTPEQPCCPLCPACTRDVELGRTFRELWKMGAPWPVRRWTCDAHGMDGCLTCKRKAEGDDR